MTRDEISWKLNDRPIRLADWSCDKAVDVGGPRDFSGVAAASRVTRLAEQEAPLMGWRADGTLFWGGTLTLDPDFAGGVVSLVARGAVRDIEADTSREFFQDRDESSWVAADADPHNYPFNEKFDADAKPGKLDYVINPETYASGQHAGLVKWVEGDEIDSIKWTMHKNTDLGNFDLTLYTGTGPSGGLTLKSTKGLGPANPDGTEFTVNGIGTDLIRLTIEANAANTPTQRRRVWCTDVIVRGRCGDSDEFSVAEVAATVLDDAGFTYDMAASLLDAMPLDWTESHVDLLNYILAFEDWRWLVTGRDANGAWHAQVGPWADTIKVSRARNARTQLAPLPRYNGVRIESESTSGVPRSVLVMADPDPFPGRQVIAGPDVHGIEVGDRQPGDALVSRLGTAQANYLASVRRVGSVELNGARAGGVELSPYAVGPGVFIDVTDHDPPIPPQRAVAARYGPDGQVSVDLTEELSTVRLLAHVTKDRRRKGKKHRRRH